MLLAPSTAPSLARRIATSTALLTVLASFPVLATGGPAGAAPGRSDRAAGATAGDTVPPQVVMRVPRTVPVDRPVALDARGSSDDVTPSDALTYTWDQGNGGSTSDASGRLTSVRYRRLGTYRVALTVADEAGNTTTETRTVTVVRYVTCSARAVDRQGAWRVKRASAAQRGVYCDTSSKRRGPDRVSYSFSGDSLQVAFARKKSGGVADLTIDGKKMSPIRFSDPLSHARRIRFGHVRTYPRLGAGRHTIRIVMRRGDGFLEGFVVRS